MMRYAVIDPAAPSPQHVQCELTRGGSRAVTWLPEAFATVGRVLTLRHPVTGTWQRGWRVVATWTVRPTESVLRDARTHAHYRSDKNITKEDS